MIQYRKANECDIEELSKMVAESFGEYPLLDIVLRDRFKNVKDYIAFTSILYRVNIKVYLKNQVCLVGVKDSEICCVTILERPSTEEIGLWDYICAGGLRLIPYVGFFRLIEMMRVVEEGRKEIIQQHNDAWYVEMLSVNKEYQGQRIGSQMIKDCIVPYVKEHGGKEITLITNTEINRKFYIKNGFREFFGKTIQRMGKKAPNWSYFMVLT